MENIKFQLENKDLVHYLPHDLLISFNNRSYVTKLLGLDTGYYANYKNKYGVLSHIDTELVKPLLIPVNQFIIDSLNKYSEEQYSNCIYFRYNKPISNPPFNNPYESKILIQSIIPDNEISLNIFSDIYNILHKAHIDVYNLIDKGIAFDKNDEKFKDNLIVQDNLEKNKFIPIEFWNDK